jgi:hypothetical protein
MITAVCIAAFRGAFALFNFAVANPVSTILVGHLNSPPSSVIDSEIIFSLPMQCSTSMPCQKRERLGDHENSKQRQRKQD